MHTNRMLRTITLGLDSYDRFERDFRNKPFYLLPHDENGFNHLIAHLSDDNVYWHGHFLFALTDLPRYNPELQYYAYFITEDASDTDSLCDSELWVRPPLVFGNIPITDAWITIDLAPHAEDLEDEEYVDVPGESCAISGTIEVAIQVALPGWVREFATAIVAPLLGEKPEVLAYTRLEAGQTSVGPEPIFKPMPAFACEKPPFAVAWQQKACAPLVQKFLNASDALRSSVLGHCAYLFPSYQVEWKPYTTIGPEYYWAISAKERHNK